MPKRTNEFQSLITLIKQQLACEGVRVTESKELIDSGTGEKREVDIVLESSLAGHMIVVGIECTSQTRPATVEWVEQMAAKHQFLPTDKLVLISKSGFTEGAIEKARLLTIDTCSLEEATAANWKTAMNLREVLFMHRRLYPAEFTFEVAGMTNASSQVRLSDILLHFEDGERTVRLVSLIRRILADTDVRAEVDANGQASRKLTFREGTYFLAPDGSQVTIQSVHFVIRYMEDESTIQLHYGSLGESQIAYGSAHNRFGTVVVSIVEGSDEPGILSAKVIPQKEKNK